MWGQTIRVVIVPLFLAISFLGQSINSHWYLISRLQFIAPGPLAIWLAESFATPVVQGQPMEYIWGPPTIIASFTLSIAVNALVTGLIVFKILGVFLEVKAATTSVERTLGKAWAGTKLRHVVFVIIESGMALLVVQLARLIFYILQFSSYAASIGYVMLISINEMLNVISIRSVRLLLLFFTDNILLPG